MSVHCKSRRSALPPSLPQSSCFVFDSDGTEGGGGGGGREEEHNKPVASGSLGHTWGAAGQQVIRVDCAVIGFLRGDPRSRLPFFKAPLTAGRRENLACVQERRLGWAAQRPAISRLFDHGSRAAGTALGVCVGVALIQGLQSPTLPSRLSLQHIPHKYNSSTICPN